MAPKRKRTSSPERASSSGTGTTYQVFLSFRGPDTRRTITDVLYHDLVREGICVFRDDEEIRKGEDIGDEIRRAIGDSKIFVPIFSKGYASSKWCLMELAMFKAIQDSDSDKKILPIFFEVGVDDVKLKTELYTEALKKHREKFSHDEVQRWEEALRKAGQFKGWEVKNMGYGEFSKLFVTEVSTKLKAKHKYVTDKIVQRDDDVDGLMKLLDIGAAGIKFVGIHGMGGMGKTTLARIVYNKLCNRHGYYCSFLDDVRESSQRRGIQNLQKQLLKNLGFNCTNIKHVDDGVMELSKNLQGKKVLIVLDDVDNTKQMKNLAGNASWFREGSRIIITTRDKEVLGGGVELFELSEMNAEEALQLFSKHAFDKDSPPNDFLDLSKEAVESTGRLPLALEVIGSELRQTPDRKWAKTIERLKKMPHKDVQEMLMISYKSLSRGAQQIFLDIACFFIGHDRAIPMYMWEACDPHAKRGLKELIHKSLVKIFVKKVECVHRTGKVKRLWMHDQLRDLGRNIAELSRRWVREDALNLLRKEEGRVNVEMLRLCDSKDIDMVSWKEFSGLKKLRYLECCETISSCNKQGLLPNLRWLSWRYCPVEFTGTGLYFRKLVILDLSDSNITEAWTGWSKIGEANNLKVLDLSCCEQLRRTPDLSKCSSLERLILQDCTYLEEIDPSIGKLKGLKFLNVNYCIYLKGFPDELCSLDCLEVILGHCEEIDDPNDPFEFNFPESIGNLTSLLTLGFCLRKTTRLPESITRLSGLRHLSLSGIVELPQGVGLLEKLEILDLTYCPYMEELPDSIGYMKSLVELNLSGSGITELPEVIGNLEKLRVMDLSESSIHKLPNSIGQLKSLEELIIAHSCYSFTQIPSTIKGCTSLRILALQYCEGMKELPDSIGYLTSLTELNLSHTNVSELPSTVGNLKELRMIRIDSSEIRTLPPSIGMLKKLEELSAIHCLSFREIPSAIGGCISLRELMLNDCAVLKELPDSVGNLRSLQKLDLSCSGITELPETIGNLKELTMLRVDGTWIRRLPASIVMQRSQLWELYLEGCKNVRELPVSARYLRLLHTLDLSNSGIIELPETIGNLKELRMLRVDGTGIRRLPASIGMLESLQKLSALNCVSLEEIPSTINGCTQLRELYLEGCKNVWELPVSACYLRSLHTLDLSNSGIIELPETIGNLKELRMLRVDGTGIRRLPDSIGTLESLQMISALNCVSLEEIPSTINVWELLVSACYLRLLHTLDLSNSGIIELPETIGNLKEMRMLRLDGSGIRRLPDSIGTLESLQMISALNCVSLEEIPSTINGCTQLRELYLRGCKNIRELPISTCDLRSLHTLDLSYSGIIELPETIGNLKELRMLRVDGTWIRRFPASIGLLNSLQTISALNCVSLFSLDNIPPTVEVWTMAGEGELDLRGFKNMTPVSECHLTSLTELYLPRNFEKV